MLSKRVRCCTSPNPCELDPPSRLPTPSPNPTTHSIAPSSPAPLQADIIIAACGKAEMVEGDWVKEGAAVIDVGINAVDGALRGCFAVGLGACETAYVLGLGHQRRGRCAEGVFVC